MGGSSSGGGWNRLGDIRSLEEKAKAALQGGKRNVFISFAAEDIDDVNLLRAHAKNENSDIEFSDHSVRKPYDSEQADYIRRKIAERIARSSTTVVYISENTAQSQWVAWEVQKSLELGKRVIAVHSGEHLGGKSPDWLTGNIKTVAWAKLADELE
ncbi:TIR domain-containing protein [Marinobacter sp. 71-i]|uniref:TIR domain-containing protein n=1 Tax=Marinobacter iranensis TaxID=2962607 RepID=A0ABT5Y916_9GAMM|nr:TIR domain-containing protein [Marinobacter iranensis]MDF0750157.1 TIR domain-containing protein [Marinobacter iranensis]